MNENNIENVYVSNCGKKYHFSPNCSYIKGKSQSIPFITAKRMFVGPCSRCQNLLSSNNINNNNQFQNNNNNGFKKNKSVRNCNRNNHFFQFNNNLISNELKNPKKIKKEKIYLKNNYEEDKKINEIKEDNISSLNKKTKISDSLILSGSESILAGNLFSFNKKSSLIEKSSELDFNNNKFSTLNKNFPFPLNNNLSSITMKNDNSSGENDINYLFNKNSGEKDEEEKKKILQSITEEDDNKISQNSNSNISKIHKYNNINESFNNKINLKNENSKSQNSSTINSPSSNKIYYLKEAESSISQSSNNIRNNNNIALNSSYVNEDDSLKEKINNKGKNNNRNNKKINNNKLKKKINLNLNDIKILEETDKNSKFLFFENLQSPSINTTNITHNPYIETTINKNEKVETKNNNYENGNFKFTFEVNPKNSQKSCINIEVGFEVEYFDENDICKLNGYESEEDSEFQSDEITLNSICQKFCVLRQFNIFKKTNLINVLINLEKGKFIIIGEEELNILTNNEYLIKNKLKTIYISDCQKLKKENIKEVRPIFYYNKKDINLAEIMISGRFVDSEIL